MAGWQDFISAIDEERKKAGKWIGDRAQDVGNFASGAGEFVGDVLQGIPRGVVNIGLSLGEESRNQGLDSANKNIDAILGISQEERERLASVFDDPQKANSLSDEEWSKAYIIRKAQKELGSLDDDTLKKRKASNEEERKKHYTYKADNDFMKFLIGGEEDEVAQSAHKTNEDITKWGEEQGLSKGQASVLGGVGAIGLTALDAPTGIGSIVKGGLVKGVGKGGIKQLAKETTEEGVEQIIRKQVPKLSDDAVKQLVPQLVQAGDKKAVTNVLKTFEKDVLKNTTKKAAVSSTDDILETATDDVAENVLKRTPGVTDDVVDTGIDSAKQIAPTTPPKPGQYGDAVDEILGNIRTSDELKDQSKKKFGQAFKEQFVDKLSPVNDMVKLAEEKTGKKLLTEDNPYELMRLYNGMPDMVQQRVRGLTDILKQAPDLNAVKALGVSRQIKARAAKGVSSFKSSEVADRAIQQLRQQLGDEKFDQVAKTVDAVTDYNRVLLKELNDAGIVSDDAYKAIQASGSDYFSRFNVVEHILKNEQNTALFSKTGSYNTTTQGMKKVLANLKGMEEGSEILDPIESIVRSTDLTMRAIAKNKIWHAFDRLADEVPELVVRTRDPENVTKRIALSLDNKELRPIRNKLDRMISTRGQWVRRLESQINQLNKKGLNLSLKSGGERMAADDFLVEGLGGKVPTSQVGKMGATAKRVGDETVQGFMDVVNPQKLGPQDTGKFLRNLIEKGSRSDIDKIKKMIGTRDAKLVTLLDDLGEMKSQFDDVAGTIKDNSGKIREMADEAVPEGMAQISGFGKGVQGKLAVPKEIADVFTGKTASQQDYLTSMISNVNSFVKQNFTSNNPAFALITNPIRDAKTFAYNAKDVKADPLSIGKALAEGLWARTFGKGELYERWVAAGGKSGFYADERDATRLAKDLAREISGKRVLGVKVAPVTDAKSFREAVGRIMTAPLRTARDSLHGAASVLEDTPRLAQFKASVKAGKTDAQAAFNARNVTVDFQQAGRIGQTVNAWIPFLNARFQGTLKSAEAIKRNPARAAAVYAGLTATPIIMAAANNARFPEVMKMIPDQDRENNFIIVLGDAQDEDGNFTQVIKIPKSDVDKILGNPLEQVARFVADDDPASLDEILINMVGQTLPFDTVRDGQFSVERTVGSLLPPLIKAPVEAVTNRNLYFGSDIVPRSLENLPADEQRRDNTSALAEWTAPLLGGGSPLKAENTIRNFTGSLLTKAPQDQMGGKLSGVSSNKMNDEFYKVLNKTSPNRASASKYINEALARGDYAAAKQAADTYNAYLRESFTPFGQSYGQHMTAELAGIYDEQKIVLTSRSIKQRQRNQLEREAAGQ